MAKVNNILEITSVPIRATHPAVLGLCDRMVLFRLLLIESAYKLV